MTRLIRPLAMPAVLLAVLAPWSALSSAHPAAPAAKATMPPVCGSCHKPEAGVLRGYLEGVAFKSQSMQLGMGGATEIIRFDPKALKVLDVQKPLPYKSVDGLQHLDIVIEIDQSPIGRTPRSNPATYTGVFTDIRKIYASRPEAKIRGYQLGRFSFNVAGGRCETCEGAGKKLIEMNFLPDVLVNCETCLGKRYNRETLEIRYKGKSISDVLEMPVEEAAEFFSSIPSIYRKIKTLNDVGLGYITLGQQATTLSGGEAKRVKLV